MARKVTLTTAILRNWWKQFNSEYFNGELTMPDRFELTKSKRALGQFASNGGMWYIPTMTIRISIYYDRCEHDFQETLLHEMIHQWQFEQHLPVDHKANFKKKAAQINKQGGWSISRTTNVDDGVADGIAPKKRLGSAYLIKFTRNGQIPAFAFLSTNLWEKLRDKRSINFLKTSPYYGGDMEVYYLSKRPDTCSRFVVNRANIRNYNYDTYKDIISPVFKTATKVAF